MKTIHLHIGTHKTGTTTLQKILAENRDLLTSHGYCYPVSGTEFTPGHYSLIWSIKSGDYRKDRLTGKCITVKDAWPNVLTEINSVTAGHIILSGEDFCLFSEAEIERAKQYLADYRVRIHVILRRQDEFFLSLYSERVKKGYGRSFKAFIQEKRFRGEYDEILARWERVFGRSAISVGLYTKDRNLITVFLEMLNLGHLKVEELKLSDGQYNRSLPGKVIKIIRWFNVVFVDVLSLPLKLCWRFYLLPLQQGRARRMLQKIPNLLVDDQILSPSLANEIMASFEESNTRVARRYFPSRELPLFQI